MGAHVLIVEDDENIRGLVQRTFVRGGYMVRTATEGVEALRLLGIEVLSTLRQRPQLANIPVLVTTGTATSAYDLRDFGPLRVLHKPFELASVVPAAERLLRSRE